MKIDCKVCAGTGKIERLVRLFAFWKIDQRNNFSLVGNIMDANRNVIIRELDENDLKIIQAFEGFSLPDPKRKHGQGAFRKDPADCSSITLSDDQIKSLLG